jgi:threonine/homoserine/homoserine lactone efflux protein
MAGVWAFLAVSLLVIATPGPDTALTVRNSSIGGHRGGRFTALGVAAGQTIWALGSALGLVAAATGAALVVLGLRLAAEQRYSLFDEDRIGRAFPPHSNGEVPL